MVGGVCNHVFEEGEKDDIGIIGHNPHTCAKFENL